MTTPSFLFISAKFTAQANTFSGGISSRNSRLSSLSSFLPPQGFFPFFFSLSSSSTGLTFFQLSCALAGPPAPP